MNFDKITIESAKTYASTFVDEQNIDAVCHKAVEEIIERVLSDLKCWQSCGKELDNYQVSYGINNFCCNHFGLDAVAERCLISPQVYGYRYHDISSDMRSFWDDRKLKEGGFVEYREYEIECYCSLVEKIERILIAKLAENKYEYAEQINVNRNYRGYFEDRGDHYNPCKKYRWCLIPCCWPFFMCDESSKYDGEALLVISINNGT
ncbi:MAG: hypothetical protein AAGG81_06410 [Chlamydiota bacterium]